MARFSGTVKIGDLNDFIAPSQACVVSLQGGAADAKPPAQLLEEEGKVQLHARGPAPGGFKQTYTPGGAAEGPVKVTLNDCLACSGCVTSAETVLLEAQSTGELSAKLTEPGAVVVVSVSPQSRASLAALHGLRASEVQARLTTALRRIGVAAVLDLGVAKEMALAEAVEEFIARYERAASGAAATSSSAPAAAAAGAPAAAAAAAPGPLPMLASACPGWVCYAEKTQAGGLLPHISSAKSPQAIMGTIVKRWLAAARGWRLDKVYHATVMPCYDKKLEAARDDFQLPGSQAPEVDNSLTTGELQQLLEGWQLGALAEVPPTAPDTLFPTSYFSSGSQQQQPAAWEAAYADDRACGAGGEPPPHGAPGGSGGYMEGILRAAAGRLLGAALPRGAPLPVKTVRNADFKEIVIEPPSATALDCAAAAGGGGSGGGGGRPLRFAAAYGFRNIQSLMRKIKLGRCEYDYVEVMACPGGCLNGGGQLKPRPGVSAAQLLDELESLYFEGGAPAGDANGSGSCCGGGGGGGSCAAGSGEMDGGGAAAMDVDGGGSCEDREAEGAAGSGGGESWQPPLSATARALYREWVGGGPGSPGARALLHTAYHHREKTALTTVGDW